MYKMRIGALKEKKAGTVFQLPLLGNWILPFGQIECCFVEKGDGLQTSVGPLEKSREKSGYFWDFFGLRVWNNSRYISNCIFKIIFFNIKKIIFFMGFSSQPSRLDLSFFILHSYLVFIFLFKIIFFMFLNNFLYF